MDGPASLNPAREDDLSKFSASDSCINSDYLIRLMK